MVLRLDPALYSGSKVAVTAGCAGSTEPREVVTVELRVREERAATLPEITSFADVDPSGKEQAVFTLGENEKLTTATSAVPEITLPFAESMPVPTLAQLLVKFFEKKTPSPFSATRPTPCIEDPLLAV
jgi:hypothetical protein